MTWGQAQSMKRQYTRAGWVAVVRRKAGKIVVFASKRSAKTRPPKKR